MNDIFTIALVGNPNSGKTTLFNLLTKSGEPVGNRAGVTFSAKRAPLRHFFDRKNVYILDLPGIYSLSNEKNEEKTTLHALKKERIDVILNIIDATNLEQGLCLTLSLLSLGIPVVAAFNMMDEAEKEGLSLDISVMKKELGIPIFPISAAKNKGIKELLDGCLQAYEIPKPFPFSTRAQSAHYIDKLLANAIKKQGKPSDFSDAVDAVICRPAVGIPLFFAAMCAVFFLTFSSLGGTTSAWMERVFSNISVYLQDWLSKIGVSSWICRFLTEGVWMGVAAVLAFIPQTAILFFLLAVLEDSGYLARAAFVLDKIMRCLGVSGKAIIPMLIGFGCTVPAVMATVTLDEQEKEATVASLPFIPCNARLPILILIASAFFEENAALFAILLYLLCIFTTFISVLWYSKGTRCQDTVPLIMELPKYRFPRPVSLFREVKNKLKDFLVRAGTVVFLSCVIVDLLAMLTPSFSAATDSEESILAYLGNSMAPLFSFLGFGDGRIVSALAAGFFAKEAIVSTIQILIPEGLSAVISDAGAFSLAVFSLLYVPCAATLGAIRKELGRKKALYIFFRTLLLAFLISFLTYTGFRILSK